MQSKLIPIMNLIVENLIAIQSKIKAAEQQFNRLDNSVQLLAVTKQQSIENIQHAISAGQNIFGENYLQEALPKIKALADQNITWHFIGAIQTNKTRDIAKYFSWVHSIDRLSIAQRLNEQRPAELAPLNICLEVNIDNEPNKAGIMLEELPELAAKIKLLPQLRLRGLMAIPTTRENFIEQREPFKKLRLALEQLQTLGYQLDTLSMGMSHDFVAAIAEGATIVRIGTAIFGERKN